MKMVYYLSITCNLWAFLCALFILFSVISTGNANAFRICALN